MASSDFPVWGKLPCRHGLQHPAGQHGGNPGFEHSREVCGHHLQTPVDQDEDSPFLAFVPQPAEPASPMRHWKSHWGRGTRGLPGGTCEWEVLFHLRQACSPVGSIIGILCNLSFVSVPSCKLRFAGPRMRRGDA